MNGHEYDRTNRQEVKSLLVNIANKRRIKIIQDKECRKERAQSFFIVMVCGICILGLIALISKPTNTKLPNFIYESHELQTFCVIGCESEEWWNPNFKTDDPNGTLDQRRWTFGGNHSYTTRDLMGRKI